MIMKNLLTPQIFEAFAEVTAAMSLIDSAVKADNSQLPVKLTTEATAADNRSKLAQEMGFAPDHLVIPTQVHGDTVLEVKDGYQKTAGDALMTNQPGWLLGVTVADCAPILMFDPKKQVVAAVHSGWRGTALNIANVTVNELFATYGSLPQNLRAWIGPCGDKCCYQIQSDVADKFDDKYLTAQPDGSFLFNNKACVYDQLIEAGLQPNMIEVDGACTIHDERFFSARRQGDKSGRMIAAIGLKPTRA